MELTVYVLKWKIMEIYLYIKDLGQKISIMEKDLYSLYLLQDKNLINFLDRHKAIGRMENQMEKPQQSNSIMIIKIGKSNMRDNSYRTISMVKEFKILMGIDIKAIFSMAVDMDQVGQLTKMAIFMMVILMKDFPKVKVFNLKEDQFVLKIRKTLFKHMISRLILNFLSLSLKLLKIYDTCINFIFLVNLFNISAQYLDEVRYGSVVQIKFKLNKFLKRVTFLVVIVIGIFFSQISYNFQKLNSTMRQKINQACKYGVLSLLLNSKVPQLNKFNAAYFKPLYMHYASRKSIIFIQRYNYYRMKNLIILLILALVLNVNSKLIFSDQFDTFDLKKWKHDITLGGGGNSEFQIYQNNRTTSWVKNSKLNIRPVLTQDKIGADNVKNGFTYSVWGGQGADMCTSNSWWGCERTSNGFNYINPVMSAKVTTIQSFSFKYGRVQVKAKLPKGNWLWPAIWLMPRYQNYGTWPASGEIDIMQSKGNVGYPKQAGGGPQSFESTLHWGPDWLKNQFQKTHGSYSLPNGTLADDFHVYGLYWDDKQLYTYIDNDSNRVLQVNHTDMSYWDRGQITDRANPWQYSPNKCAPFDSQFYLIINLAIGGIRYFRDGVANKPWKDNSARPQGQFYDNKGQWINTWTADSIFQIDSVNVWDLQGKQQILTQ